MMETAKEWAIAFPSNLCWELHTCSIKSLFQSQRWPLQWRQRITLEKGKKKLGSHVLVGFLSSVKRALILLPACDALISQHRKVINNVRIFQYVLSRTNKENVHLSEVNTCTIIFISGKTFLNAKHDVLRLKRVKNVWGQKQTGRWLRIEKKPEHIISSREMSVALSALVGVKAAGASSHGSNSRRVHRLIVIAKGSLGCLEDSPRNSIHWFPRRQPLSSTRSHNMV